MLDKNLSSNFEYQYQNYGNYILANGIKIPTRTGIDCITISHGYIYCQDVLNNFPIIKGKKMYPKLALKEMMWFLMGKIDIQWLHDRGVTYWDEWALTETDCVKKLLNTSFVGTVGKSYGYQFRDFNGIDQVASLIEQLAKDPFGRRHIINIWNPADYNQMALPSCVYDYNFQSMPTKSFWDTEKGKCQQIKLDLHIKARSIDYFLGLPYDLLLGGWILHIITQIINGWYQVNGGIKNTLNLYFVPGDIHFTIANFHIYENHIPQVNEYITNVNENKIILNANPEAIEPINQKVKIELPFANDFIVFAQEANSFKEYIDTCLETIDKNYDKIIIPFYCSYDPIKAQVAI